MQRHFYATANDLLPIFEWVEKKHELTYNLTGLFESSRLAPIYHGIELPSLHLPAPYPSATGCPCYLVTLRATPVLVRKVPQNRGGVRFAVDQLLNPDSIILQHGGLFGSNVLLYGRVGTVSINPVATKLHRVFSSAITKHFRRIQSFWVGPEAAGLLSAGYRLTIGAKAAHECDLVP